MEERPNVTVIYQTPPSSGPTLGVVLVELVLFVILAGIVAIGCGLLQ